MVRYADVTVEVPSNKHGVNMMTLQVSIANALLEQKGREVAEQFVDAFYAAGSPQAMRELCHQWVNVMYVDKVKR